ncbi:hypothetical protein [Microlunatus parietis]|uniref:Uncharacterized protein n=1 Tax=Microlunatus parietis TaxID=682979 RepID=A0A7Y9IF57_9ACTN|nr:hypothetical protein [Microlunatus parietis]NYE75501.1 hypothetical protein [Microlunatus parietis]
MASASALPTTDDEFQSFREEVCLAFGHEILAEGSDATAQLGLLLDWKWSYGDRRLDRLTRDELEEFLLEWCPSKLSAAGAGVAELPYNIAAGVDFLAEEGILRSGDSRARLADHARRLAAAFVEEMDNPANFGMAKSIFASMGVSDPTQLDPEELQRLIDQFNQLPQDQRVAITGGERPGFDRQPVVIGPVVEPSDEAVRASAEKAPVLQGFRAFADYLGPDGKTLTKTGALKLADARELVERLGTGDQLEMTYGDQTYRKRSARDLPELDHWHWWAMETGAIREVRGRLVPVKAWHKRVRDDPSAEARKAAEVLLSYGPAGSYLTRSLTAHPDLVDAAIPMLLSPLLTGPGPLDFAELVAQFRELAASQGELDDPMFDSWSVSRALQMVERAGMIEQSEVVTERTKFDTEIVVSAKITITPLGVVALIDELRRQGIEVETASDLGSSTFDTLVAMINKEAKQPADWWTLVDAWLGALPDRALDSAEVADALAAVPTAIMMLDTTVPEHLRPPYLTVLRRIADRGTPQDPSAAAALTVLVQLDPAEAGRMTVDLRDQLLVTMIAVTGAEAMKGLINAGANRAYELIKVAARFPCPSSESMLALVGERHPDKGVAKAARKELFRLRSKLAAARS